MPSITPPPTPAPEQACPTCGLDGEGTRHDRGGIFTASYICPAGHIWLTKWADLGEPA